MDTDSVAGTGTSMKQYKYKIKQTTNLIIYGHTDEIRLDVLWIEAICELTYGRSHSMICFDSLYEKRKYELIAVSYSQVLMNTVL